MIRPIHHYCLVLMLPFLVLLSPMAGLLPATVDPAVRSSTFQEVNASVFKAATYNIRYDAAADTESGNGWEIRKKPVVELMQKHGFDIVGTQEGDAGQLADVLELMPGYAVTAYPYGGKGDLHNAAIFYRKDLFEPLDQGVFWLSETPEQQSIGWDASDPRICQWVHLRDQRNGKEFYFFNAHFYWRNKEAKAQSGPLIARKVSEIAGDRPAFLVGDFNSTAETDQVRAIAQVLDDAFDKTQIEPKGSEDTNLGGGNFIGPPKGRIDYIFVSPQIQVRDYEVYADRYGSNRYPSDHLPVACQVAF